MNKLLVNAARQMRNAKSFAHPLRYAETRDISAGNRPPTLAEIYREMAALGVTKPIHTERIFRLWLSGKPLDTPSRKSASVAYPNAFFAVLPEFSARLATLARICSEHPARDGSNRLLLDLADGARAECVLLPKEGLCVSTQVGCAVGCVFCATGQYGLKRQMTDAEILAQAALARSLRGIRRVVFMGMGEPAHNLEAVLSAIHMLGTLGGIGHKQLVVSSVGDARLFERLVQMKVRPALALSLHSADPEKRVALLPNAPKLTPEQLVAAGEIYARASGHPIQYQWTLLEGVNDGEDEMAGVIRLLTGKYAMMNLIAYNGSGALKGASGERLLDWTRRLNRVGILTRIRHSAGQEVEGGCGQLWARAT